MPISLAFGDASSPTNPLLVTHTGASGVLAAPFALAFAIHSIADDSIAPVQLYPALPATRATVDLEADALATGTYVATWTAPDAGDAPEGRTRITWYCTQTEGGAETRWSEDFELLPMLFDAAAPSYALVADVRDEGVTVARAGNRRVLEALAMATAQVELWTGRRFRPERKVIKVDGTPSTQMLLDEPICMVESVLYEGDSIAIDPTTYRVYSRHLTQRLFAPDDRDTPRIVYVRRVGTGTFADVYPVYPLASGWSDLRTPRSRAQEVQLTGVFGYTDPDGSPMGRTPLAIRKAIVLMALRELPKQGVQADKVFDARYGDRVISQRTREQTIAWSARPVSDGIAPFTGDQAIDSILLTYMKPVSATAV